MTKLVGILFIFRKDDYENYEGPDLIVVNDENMQIINQLFFNQLKENSFEELEDDEFVDFVIVLINGLSQIPGILQPFLKLLSTILDGFSLPDLKSVNQL